jgi:hypothetical protein
MKPFLLVALVLAAPFLRAAEEKLPRLQHHNPALLTDLGVW